MWFHHTISLDVVFYNEMVKTVTATNAKIAINTMQLVADNLGAAFCAYIVPPNAVLTLANGRGFADGVFYHPSRTVLKQWQQEMRQLFAFLKKHRSFIYVTEIIPNPGDQWYVGYDFMNPDGLRATLPSYSFIDAAMIEKMVQHDSLVTLVENLMHQLSQQSTLVNKYAPHLEDITSGVILGYPEKAILSTVTRFDKPTDEFPEQLVQANIRGADYYPGPQPLYDYPRKLIDDPEIKKHEDLWSAILHDYYTSPFYKALARDAAFATKIKALTEF
jgi:hypothetical protein